MGVPRKMPSRTPEHYLKLGTGLRYLIDLRGGETLGGKHVLSNLRTVLELIPELGFRLTRKSSGFQQLESLCAELDASTSSGTSLSPEQAGRVSEAARKVRTALFTEAKGMTLTGGGLTAAGLRVLATIQSAVILCGAAVFLVSGNYLGFARATFVAFAVLVIAVAAIWSNAALRNPAVWLGFIGLIAGLLL